ncbi:MAG: sensor histidine kinase [Chloroflexota bacterium]
MFKTWQRHINLTLLAIQLSASLAFFVYSQWSHASEHPIVRAGAFTSVLLYAAMLWAYWRGWEPARRTTVLLLSLLIGFLLPEPFVTNYAAFVIIIPPALALVLAEPIWILASAATVLLILIVRAGGEGAYTAPSTLLMYGMALGGMTLSRLMLDIARREAEQQAAQIQTLNTELETRVRTRTLALEATNKELDAFSYSVSHDLRAPLRHINSYSKILMNDHAGQLSPEGRTHLERISDAGQKMNQLIDDLLRLSRVTSLEMHLTPVDLALLAQPIVNELYQSAPHRPATITMPPTLPARADPSLIHIVLLNLLHNAWKFTSQTPNAAIELGQLPAPPDSKEAVYFVRDNGVGFDMQYAKKLFTPFQRLHSAEEFEGTGIGLTLVQRIIRRHGGNVWVEAAPNQGATFFFTLPTNGKHP